MLKITDAIKSIVAENPLLQFGMQNRLLNLTQTAVYLRPLVEVKAKKEVTVSALTMALSRLQNEIKKTALQREIYHMDQVSMHTGLSTYTFTKTPETHAGVNKLYQSVQRAHGYITIAQGTTQITVILDSRFSDKVKQYVSARPRFHHKNIASVGVSFDEKYLQVPGIIYIVLQQVMLLNINILEVSSTYTELALYVAEEDLKTAFEALQYLFCNKQ
jgi:hypothetical protein